ncbi:MAG: hypothetical protein EBU54_17105 [Mycobacteriaceae bacterium]|nr:hypothetical protein [Mycobacteriaceae bacterium]
MGERGSAVVEYAGIVAVIACLFGGLLVLRPASAGRHAPVRPIPAIIRLIQAPAAPVLVPSRPRRPRTRRPSRRPRPAPPEIWLPAWLTPGVR